MIKVAAMAVSKSHRKNAWGLFTNYYRQKGERKSEHKQIGDDTSSKVSSWEKKSKYTYRGRLANMRQGLTQGQ